MVVKLVELITTKTILNVGDRLFQSFLLLFFSLTTPSINITGF